MYGCQANCAAGKWSNVTGSGIPCSLDCSAGYVCVAGSTSPQAAVCGGPQYYCPVGSAASSTVDIGNYTYGGTSVDTQTAQAACPSPTDPVSNSSSMYCPGDGYMYV